MRVGGNQSLIWVSKHAALPDVCVTCGMFTDARVTAKYKTTVETMVEDTPSSSGLTGLGCLLFLLGPIGILISVVMALLSRPRAADESSYRMEQRTMRGKLKVPCCVLCQTEGKITPEDGDIEAERFAIRVHRNFERKYQELNPSERL